VVEQSDISRVNIRIGRIVQCEKHPQADQLYVEKIDLGEGAPRTIVSGLVPFVPLDQMMNRLVLVVANLPPRNFKGINSEGMVLAASTEAHDKVELLDAPEGVAIGERIMFEGEIGEPEAELNPKKKVFDRVKIDFKINGHLIATYQNKPFLTSKGPITVKSLINANIG